LPTLGFYLVKVGIFLKAQNDLAKPSRQVAGVGDGFIQAGGVLNLSKDTAQKIK
jgi:hypothetical protein